jgi:hypothetical protein
MTDKTQISELVEIAAIELIHRDSLDEIEALLADRNIIPETALRLLLLIPSAFAREYFEAQGVSFPDSYFSGPQGHFVSRPYSTEPIYDEARLLARKWISESRLSLVQRILDWSAEANLIKQAKEKGSTLKRISEVHHGF